MKLFKKVSVFFMVSYCIFNPIMHSHEHDTQASMEVDAHPEYLYKIVSMDSWNESQSKKFVSLSSNDNQFIHLATAEQLDKIIEKFWPDADQFVVLKLQTSQLQGEMIYESNPGGMTKYYHLYDGSIPVASIVEAKIIYQK